ncbi:hypothetical protein [Arsukibacterium sp.]|uniref:hypothetical protein n=1 Tax=Arsukibacterium sp. TaxID=1977258 RepID=UPI00299DF22A|nr:hypothetical protein [Arsukibacterium sp.]MDX1536729.1 hypothetical protein [Arsukibacterium sp.]
MNNTFKVLLIATSLTIISSNSSNSVKINEPVLLDNLYACPWWPACKDPEDLSPKPVPTDSSVPKPTGDKDTTKDKKDETRLA